jgi:molecular chaperone GrpE
VTDAHDDPRAGAGAHVASASAPAPDTPAGGHGSGNGGAELAAMEDRYKRALAELDNYRKRAARDVQTQVQQSRESQLRDWLEIVDSVERALQMSHGTPAADGLRALLEQMEALLARQGARRIGAAGEPFDPERHEAIEARPTAEAPDRTVLEAARSGWAVGDRVVRPALVVVARRPDAASG